MALFTEGKLFKKAGEGSGGGGGGDQHNLGWYATQAALEEAHPTATAGDWAIVGATDTVWIWDTDTSAWKDSDQKGQVTSVNGQTGDVVLDLLPSQTGNAGKFLTTDGTDASWSDKPLVNTATGTNSVGVLGTASQDSSVVVGVNATTGVGGSAKVAIGNNASATGNGATAIGQGVTASGLESIAIGQGAKATGAGAIQIKYGTNSTANTMQFGSYTLVSADGTIPEARLADTTNAQQGDVLTLDANGNAVWQAGGSSGGLPSQTGQSGKFLTTDGTDASWGNAITNMATANNSISILSGTNISYPNNIAIGAGITIRDTNCVTIGTFATEGGSGITIGHSAKGSAQGVSIGYESDITGVSNSTAIGYQAKAKSYNGIAIGRGTNTGLSSLGYYGNVAIGNGATIGNNMGATYQFGNSTNNEEGTVKFALSIDHGINWTNYKLLDVDGTIPTARLTKVNSTITIAVADWNGGTTVTKTVTGITATGVVLVSPDPTDQSAYTSAGIICTTQAADSLTFTCSTTPANDIDVVVVML